MSYQVIRPPLKTSFELPLQKDLLVLKVGDHAKLIFQVGKDDPERMWVRIIECGNPDVWRGAIDNDANQNATAQALPPDFEVTFHPLDIIQIYA